MINNYETIKQNVLLLTGLDDSPKLDLQIQAKIQECLAYCYREDVPAKMELPLSEVIADVLTSGVEGNVTAYHEGDMSISFGGNGNKYNGKLEGFKLIRGCVNV